MERFRGLYCIVDAIFSITNLSKTCQPKIANIKTRSTPKYFSKHVSIQIFYDLDPNEQTANNSEIKNNLKVCVD